MEGVIRGRRGLSSAATAIAVALLYRCEDNGCKHLPPPSGRCGVYGAMNRCAPDRWDVKES